MLKETEEENKVKATAAVVDSKSGTGLYTRGRGGRGGQQGHGGCDGRGGRGRYGGKGKKNQSCTYCRMDNHTTEDCWKHQREQPRRQQQPQTQSRKRA